jgi:hypothetical protein
MIFYEKIVIILISIQGLASISGPSRFSAQLGRYRFFKIAPEKYDDPEKVGRCKNFLSG